MRPVLEVSVNGVVRGRVGFPGAGIVISTLALEQPAADGAVIIHLELTGTDLNQREFLRWPVPLLALGDVLQFRLGAEGEIDAPRSTHNLAEWDGGEDEA